MNKLSHFLESPICIPKDYISLWNKNNYRSFFGLNKSNPWNYEWMDPKLFSVLKMGEMAILPHFSF